MENWDHILLSQEFCMHIHTHHYTRLGLLHWRFCFKQVFYLKSTASSNSKTKENTWLNWHSSMKISAGGMINKMNSLEERAGTWSLTKTFPPSYLYAAISMSRAIFTLSRSWYSFKYRAISLFVVLSSFSNLLIVSCWKQQYRQGKILNSSMSSSNILQGISPVLLT